MGGTTSTVLPAVRTPRSVYVRRRVVLGLALVLLVLLVVGGWLAWGLRSAAKQIQSEASAAQGSITTVKTDLEAGDYASAMAAAKAAKAQVASADAASRTLPVRVAGMLPVVGGAVDDLHSLIGAATDLADASYRVATVYGAATGKAATGPKLFAGGRVNFRVLDETSAAVATAITEIGHAQGLLQQVNGTLPGTHAMADARDKALAEIAPLTGTLRTMSTVLGRMPAALGKGGHKSYLLVTLNPAELYAGGGAALSAALVSFSNGVMSIPLKGSVSGKLFPSNPRVAWDHLAGMPYYSPGAKAAFAYSDLHPDFTVAAVDMERAWVANGEKPVDGVIAIDPTALSAALRVSGPIQSPAYGEVNADNLVQKLLVDAYVNFNGNQDLRHQLNDELMTTVFDRLKAGSGALSLAKALASTAPGRHFRVYVNDPGLQQIVVSSGLAGDFPSSPGDLLAVFSQNQNGSKVDIFQKRTVTRDVTVKADGSATVTTTVSATNTVPRSDRRSTDLVGYLTPWSFNWYLAYLPRGAELVSYTAPRRLHRDINDGNVYPDEDGRSVVRTGRWTAAGKTTVVTLVYTFPAGTFSTSHGLVYELTTVPQPLTQDATMSITVRGPGTATAAGSSGSWTVTGGVAHASGPFNQVSSTSVTWR